MSIITSTSQCKPQIQCGWWLSWAYGSWKPGLPSKWTFRKPGQILQSSYTPSWQLSFCKKKSVTSQRSHFFFFHLLSGVDCKWSTWSFRKKYQCDSHVGLGQVYPGRPSLSLIFTAGSLCFQCIFCMNSFVVVVVVCR